MSESIATTIRMDSDLKQQFENTCAKMGLTVTTAISIFAKKVVRDQKIPFEITTDTPNSDTATSIEHIRNNTHLSRPFHSVKELMADLNADD